MTREIYYAVADLNRPNPIKEFIYGLFRNAVSTPRAILECFSRSKFGHRYYSFTTCCIIAFVLALVPISRSLFSYAVSYGQLSTMDFILHYVSWYAFLIYYIVTCVKRYKECELIRGKFNFEVYTKCQGQIDQRILNFTFQGKKFDIRTIETVIEPGLFLLIGLVLILLSQPIGFVILSSSICYSVSYFHAYRKGDNAIYDSIDRQIFSEQWVNAYIKNLPIESTKGVHIFARKATTPAGEEAVKKVFDEDDFKLYVS